MEDDLFKTLEILKSGQNPTPGQGSSSDGTVKKDFGLRSINESAKGKKKP